MSQPAAAPASAPSTGTPTVGWAAFEGLYLRVHPPTGAHAQALRELGLDLLLPKERYPSKLWQEALQVTRRHVYPQLSDEAGLRKLGTDFVDGFFGTLLGKFIASGLPLAGPERIVARFPRYWAMNREGVAVDTREEAPRTWRVTVRDPYPTPDFVAGAMEAGLAKAGKTVHVEIARREPGLFELRITW